MKKKFNESEALARVWKWKDEIFNDVKDLELKERFKKIHEMAKKVQNEKKMVSK